MSPKLTCVLLSLLLLTGCLPTLLAPPESPWSYNFWDVRPAMFETFSDGLDADAERAVDPDGPTEQYVNGSTAPYYVGEYGRTEHMNFTKRGEGAMCEVWVADDRGFASSGDPRNSMVAITDAQVQLMIDEFDDHILPIESEYFGVADPLNGSGSQMHLRGLPSFSTTTDGKAMIMVFNIVDENFFDLECPNYYAGFFSPKIEALYDRNIIHLDCFDWANRTGESEDYSYLYEMILAHEYQHLLHYDMDPYEDTFIQEGCSLYAQMVCGYGVPWAYIYYYLCTPDNSLVEWGDQGEMNLLADYGAAALFTIYLSDHFGGANYISALAANKGVGAEGVDGAFAATGHADWGFDRAFHVWKMANLIRSDDIGDGWFNYSTINLYAAWPVRTLEYDMSGGRVDRSDYFGPTPTADGLNTGVSTLGAYGVDYIRFDNRAGSCLGLYSFSFDGDAFTEDRWRLVDGHGGTMSGQVWHSGACDLQDVALRGSLDLTCLDEAVLTFRTVMDVEDGRDFCFVQISVDGGGTWMSVGNDRTVATADLDAEARIRAHLPGMTGSFSGELAFDLTEFAGQEVLYQFRCMTGSFSCGEGWYIDDVALNGATLDDGNDPVSLEPVLVAAGFTVTLYAPGYSISSRCSMPALLMEVPLSELEETVSMRQLRLYPEIYVIVSAAAGPVNYEFGLCRD